MGVQRPPRAPNFEYVAVAYASQLRLELAGKAQAAFTPGGHPSMRTQRPLPPMATAQCDEMNLKT